MRPVGETFPDLPPQEQHQQAWNQLLRDPDFAAAIRQQGISVDDAYKHFEAGLAAPAVETPPTPSHEVIRAADGTYVHQVDGKTVLHIPPTVPNAARQSEKVAMIAQGAVVLVDGVLLFLAALGLKPTMSPATKTATKSFVMKTVDNVTLGEIEPILKVPKGQPALTMAQKAMKVARMLRRWPNGLDTIKLMFTDMTLFDKIITAANLLASLALAAVSAGASIVLKVVTLVCAAVILGTDLITFVEYYEEYNAPA